MINTDVLIVGGGISGLHTACQLQKQNINFMLVEARERFGGRILSQNYTTDNDTNYDMNKSAYDLGPSWFWPGQRNIEALVHELKLTDAVFPQQGSGQAVYEDQQGNIQKGFYGISMEGTYRMQGGMRQFISALKKNITAESIKVSNQVTQIEYQDQKLIISVIDNSNAKNKHYQIHANRVVIALPPRIALSTITFSPMLSKNRINELNSYATWMAGHAKFLAIYKNPFWLEQGLSGDAVSQLGPIREIHDASSNTNDDTNKNYALFGFVGVPANYRAGNEDEIIDASIQQLVRLFGENAAKPLNVVLKDWAKEEFTATEIDRTMNSGHASSSITIVTEATFDDRLIWSGTETADHHTGVNGLLEGALEASIRTLELLT